MVIFKYTVSEKRNEFQNKLETGDLIILHKHHGPAGQQPELEVGVFVPGEREFSQINKIH